MYFNLLFLAFDKSKLGRGSTIIRPPDISCSQYKQKLDFQYKSDTLFCSAPSKSHLMITHPKRVTGNCNDFRTWHRVVLVLVARLICNYLEIRVPTDSIARKGGGHHQAIQHQETTIKLNVAVSRNEANKRQEFKLYLNNLIVTYFNMEIICFIFLRMVPKVKFSAIRGTILLILQLFSLISVCKKYL